ncbi:MAG: hypothetical protein ACTSQK_02945 [Candidatus Heimdallarchaeota archaeon]
MASYTFYPSISGTIIEVDLPSTGCQIQELVTTIRDWEDELENMEWPKILDASGKEELGGGIQVGITTTLRDAKLKFAARLGPSWILCDVFGGNLVATSGDISTYINAIEPAPYVTVTKTASSSATIAAATLDNEEVLNAVANTGAQVLNGITDNKKKVLGLY